MDDPENASGFPSLSRKDDHDSARPLRGAVVCCTSVPEEKRTKLAEYAAEMGALHRFDLTLEVTHLVVGDYNTPKYRYVAKERPDIRVMRVEWLESLRELWINDLEMDIDTLETQYALPTFATLRISMTGCEDPRERQDLADQVQANGGHYSGDLSKEITHLITFRTEGAKYNAAKKWGLQLVSVEWLRDSLERKMILEERLYHPSLPSEERGKGAWNRDAPVRRISSGKRPRAGSATDVGEARRKLRRTASTKLSSQHEGIWGDIVGGSTASVVQVSRSGVFDSISDGPRRQSLAGAMHSPAEASMPAPVSQVLTSRGIFSSCSFYLHGFTPVKAQVLHGHLLPQDGTVVASIADLGVSAQKKPQQRPYLIVPSNLPLSQHPSLPGLELPIETVTEWWLERCLYHKKLFDPQEHVIGRPFQTFPAAGFEGMTICSAAFSGIDLLHVKKATELLGATYSEDMTPQASVLVANSMAGLRKDKMEHAIQWEIPIVIASWLWNSIDAGEKLPFRKYKLRAEKTPLSCSASNEDRSLNENQKEGSKSSEPSSSTRTVGRAPSTLSLKPSRTFGIDSSVFEPDKTQQPAGKKMGAIDTSDFTAGQENVKTEVSMRNVLPSPKLAVEDPGHSNQPSRSEPLMEISRNSPTKSPVPIVEAPPKAPPEPINAPHEDITNAVSNLLAKTRTNSASAHSDNAEGGRRRGRILGRVASNVSIGSGTFSRGTSVDSAATYNHSIDHPSKDSGNSIVGSIERFMNGEQKRLQEQDTQPSSTQLQYIDDESEAYRETVVARMTGGVPKIRNGIKEKAVTLGDISERPRGRKTRSGRPTVR
ncbi:S-M checkpoint control protein rad4 [Phlyctema vagabunda]|uniref:S-M checkpoint control protein rad4 n=1 Tax=Phlyctema vagabunda TaxID=108571 RepID=A0ABR4PKE7_9HELO